MNFDIPDLDQIDPPAPKQEEKPIILSPEQNLVMVAIDNGRNVLVTGAAGTGKSTLLRAMTAKYGDDFPICASTGIAAVGVGGVTIHSWAGLGKGEDSADQIADNIIETRGKVYRRMVKATRLAIDEISMIHAALLDLLDAVLQKVRKNDQPFGGLQLILFGDFCLKKGTRVTMADGTLRKVEDIRLGESVMGPDSLPRKVLSLICGYAPLFRVQQTNGDAYTVTGNHSLALRRRRQFGRFPKTPHDTTILAKDMASKSGTFREVYGGYKAGCITLPFRPVELDPYFLGMWLGDGESTCARITTNDPEIVDYCKIYAAHWGLLCKTRPERATSTCLRVSLTSGRRGSTSQNPIHDLLRKYGVLGNKHIPEDFLLNSEENRLALLAGLLDTDGCWSGNRFIYCSVLDRLAANVKQLADQLGFRAALRRNHKDEAWEVSIGGDTWRIPTKIKRKQSVVRELGHSRMNSTLKVTPDGAGEYYGFETDGDHLFLLADGTVTHNCQLPPVSKDEEGTQFAFQAKSWKRAQIYVAMLTKVFRQQEQVFADALNKIRVGEMTKEVQALLLSRFEQVDPEPSVEAVTVYTHNEDVDRLNTERLDTLKGEEKTWDATDWGEFGPLKTLQKNCLAPAHLILKVGAQVMLLWNIETESGLANGSLGTVTEFNKVTGYPVVTFKNGLVRTIEKREWTIKLGGAVLASRRQIPLRLAWSITAHKAQGLSLDKIKVYLHRVFDYGQAYVALSRARTLEGLFIETRKPGGIRAHPEAVRFYQECARVEDVKLVEEGKLL